MGTLSGRPVDWTLHIAGVDDWRSRALCAQTDPESFFPVKGGSTRAPKSTCRRCPVREQCLDEAIASGDVDYGIRGGLAPRELRALARRRGTVTSRTDVDTALVEQLVAEGHRPPGVRLRWAEAQAVYRRLTADGMSGNNIERLYGINPKRHKRVE